MRRARTAGALALAVLGACDNDGSLGLPQGNALPARTWRMGFSAIPPDTSQAKVLPNLDMWSARADAAIMHVSVPYAELLSGVTATTYVNAVDLPLANYYRAKHLTVVVMLDVTDGLNRAAEAPALVALGRSITEPAVQAAYRQYAQALVSIVRPEYLGMAAETNLIRDLAPPTLYAALRQMANAAAADVRAIGGTQPLLYVSVQADAAWGTLLNTSYRGVEQDFADFPFMQVLGISSYPFFVLPEPEDVPLDYYTRLLNGRTLPVMVVEGGWTSASVGSIQSTPEKQARYLRRHEKILDAAKAVAVFQLTFTDLNLALFPGGAALAPFARLGLVNENLQPKRALLTYDSLFARPLAK